MSKKEEALKMAIEAMSCISQSRMDPLLKAIKACKEALEEDTVYLREIPEIIQNILNAAPLDSELAEVLHKNVSELYETGTIKECKKPLSDEQINKIIADERVPVVTGETARRFARAIEKAHDIE